MMYFKHKVIFSHLYLIAEMKMDLDFVSKYFILLKYFIICELTEPKG